MVRKRRRHTAAYKLRVALEGSKTISQLSSEHEVHPNLIRTWKRQLQEDGPRVFATNGERKQQEQEAQEAELYEQMAAARPLRLGRLKMELEWLKKSCRRRPVFTGFGGAIRAGATATARHLPGARPDGRRRRWTWRQRRCCCGADRRRRPADRRWTKCGPYIPPAPGRRVSVSGARRPLLPAPRRQVRARSRGTSFQQD